MSAYKSELLDVLASRGYIHQVSEPEALDALAALVDDHRLYRFRLHGAVAAYRLAGADHDAVLDAADRPPPDRLDGRRDHAGRRSVGQGRQPHDPHRRGDRREPQRHPQGLLEFPEVRRRPDRRHDGEQCRLAQFAQLHRLPARRRPAFLGQPDALASTRSSCGSTASRSCRSSNSTT